MSFIQFHTFNISSADLNPSTTHNSLIRSDEGLTLETSAFNLLMVANLPDQLKNSNPKFCVLRPHRRNTTVSLGTNPLVCQNRTTLFVCLFVCLLVCLFVYQVYSLRSTKENAFLIFCWESCVIPAEKNRDFLCNGPSSAPI